MAEHARFTIDTGIQVYFCDPNRRGNAAVTRTPTVCYASTYPAPMPETPEPTTYAEALQRCMPLTDWIARDAGGKPNIVLRVRHLWPLLEAFGDLVKLSMLSEQHGPTPRGRACAMPRARASQ
jgi:hypothetical protein